MSKIRSTLIFYFEDITIEKTCWLVVCLDRFSMVELKRRRVRNVEWLKKIRTEQMVDFEVAEREVMEETGATKAGAMRMTS